MTRIVMASARYAAATWKGIEEPARHGRKSVACGVGECMTPKRQSTEAARR
jgi:hypothetical protein